jgi:hypothetical protein
MSNGSGESAIDSQIEHYIRALGTSSSRVRFVMLAVIVASVAAAATLWGERSGAWPQDRLNMASTYRRIAATCQLFAHYKEATQCADELDQKGLLGKHDLSTKQETEKAAILARHQIQGRECAKECEAARFFVNYGVGTKDEAKLFAEQQWGAFVNNILYVKAPVLGLTFDINDLGLMAGTTFAILMLVMVFYTHRAHENLFLAMWKVKEVAVQKDCFDQPDSQANLLYHALAMEQVFTVPPTLARWDDFRLFRRAHYSLFFVPLVVQALVFANDVHTAAKGFAFSEPETRLSLVGQSGLIVIVASFCLLCCAHLHADDTLWDQTFYFINPSYRFRMKSLWFYWVRLARFSPPGWGLVRTDGKLFFTDTVSRAIWSYEDGASAFRYHRRSYAQGLLRSAQTLPHEYHIRWPSSRNASNGSVAGSSPLWTRAAGFSPDGRREVLPGLQDGNNHRFSISRREIERLDGEDQERWIVGRTSSQRDGNEATAGFHWIHAVGMSGERLFVTDGAWVRVIQLNGTVETWGGQPLALLRRRERPLLLGLAVDVQPSTAAGTERLEIVVCDFSLGQILAVTGERVDQLYESKENWSPTGIWLEDGHYYVLEYRRDTLRRHILNRLGMGTYIRLLCFSGRDFKNRKMLGELSHRKARKLKAKSK